ncbi:MAG: hypothetical protein ACTHM6_06845 [Tepidisphaeraceae bacterium]
MTPPPQSPKDQARFLQPNRRTNVLLRGSILCMALAGIACDPSPPPDTTPRVPVASVTGPGIIRGRVNFNGPIPPEKLVRNEPCCPGAPKTQRDESILVNPNGTLANVAVYLENGPHTDAPTLPPKKLDQIFCQYVPHVVGVVVGQTLDIHSSDPTVHNVQIRPHYAPAQNFWMPLNQTSPVTFQHPEFIHSTCDVHPWMSAYIGVFDNPFYSITPSDGTFEITGIPKGTYTLVAWHEIFGKLQQTVTIRDDQPIDVSFTYQPPKP